MGVSGAVRGTDLKGAYTLEEKPVPVAQACPQQNRCIKLRLGFGVVTADASFCGSAIGGNFVPSCRSLDQ